MVKQNKKQIALRNESVIAATDEIAAQLAAIFRTDWAIRWTLGGLADSFDRLATQQAGRRDEMTAKLLVMRERREVSDGHTQTKDPNAREEERSEMATGTYDRLTDMAIEAGDEADAAALARDAIAQVYEQIFGKAWTPYRAAQKKSTDARETARDRLLIRRAQ